MNAPAPRLLQAPRTNAHAGDIQAIVGSGFASLRHCTYWLLRISDKDRARAWLRALLDSGLVRSVADLGRRDSDAGTFGWYDNVVTLGVSHPGLRCLGVEQDASFPFPTVFRNGMQALHRTHATNSQGTSQCEWADVSTPCCSKREAHLLLAHYRRVQRTDPDSVCDPCRFDGGSGLEVVCQVETCPSYIQHRATPGHVDWVTSEPFGFRDGISQPVIDGLRMTQAERAARRLVGTQFADRVVAPGEFILGHRNEYGELSYCPSVAGWPQSIRADGSISRFALNGSYLAVMQIAQDVRAFRQYEEKMRVPGPSASQSEKMVGRRKDGTPLVDCPYAPADLDAFRYRVADADGFQCPRGAHIRRANPRDTLGWDVESGIAASKLHRLLRRGRPYREQHDAACQARHAAACGDARHMHDCGRGLFFMALNSDLERQFEFVQQRWIGSRTFNDLSGEDDPIASPLGAGAFTVQGYPQGVRHTNVPRFTQTVGGGYFFVPGLAALAFIASGCQFARSEPQGSGAAG